VRVFLSCILFQMSIVLFLLKIIIEQILKRGKITLVIKYDVSELCPPCSYTPQIQSPFIFKLKLIFY